VRTKLILAAVVLVFVFFYFNRINTVEKMEKNIQAGVAFLAQNAQQEGVMSTDSGLQYKVLSKGAGSVHPTAESNITVHYHGTLLDGSVFDSSVERGEPVSFVLKRTIPGWSEGVQLMTEGDKFRFYIASDLAYGDRSVGKISAGSLLIFDVELISINN
jgi:peptidylprolyl isomerase